MEDPEEQQPTNLPATAHTPLLPSDRALITTYSNDRDIIENHIVTRHGRNSFLYRSRHLLQRYLTSKWGHYTVIALVSLDVAGIFADFLISLHICEHKSDKSFDRRGWERTDDVLDKVSLVFSCLFMVELLASVWAFGFR